MIVINRENKYKGYLSIDEITLRTKKGVEIKREVMYRKNAVSSLVYNEETQKYIFVNQIRPGSLSDLIEIPAGTLDHEGEDKRDAMKREIEEEIGYSVKSMILLDECYMSPGGNTEIISIYFSVVDKKIGEGGGVEGEHEEIEIVEMTKEEMLSTRFRDAKTIIAVNWARYNHLTNI